MAQGVIDFRYKFGKFNGMLETNDPYGEGYKILALSNMLNMRPGTMQDCPDCGLDTSSIQFAEKASDGGIISEIDRVTERIQNDIMWLGDRFIEKGFITGVHFEIAPSTRAPTSDGSQDCKISIELKTGTVIKWDGSASNGRLHVKDVSIDKTPFISHVA